jgi:long-chain fatty acid transport protein
MLRRRICGCSDHVFRCSFAASAVAVSAVAAEAGGFYSPYQSATAIGTAFAGASARADDAGFFFYNPAIISALEGSQTFIDVRGFVPSVEIEPSRAVNALGLDVTGTGDSGNLARNALAAGSVSVIQLSEDITLGIGSSAPFATDVETRAEWAGEYHLIRSYIVGLNVTAAASLELAPWLALSAGVQIQRMENEFENTAIIPVGLAPPVEARAFMKGKDWGIGAVAGVLLTPRSGTRIGLSWRSAITHNIEGTAGANVPGLPVEHVRYDLELPQTFSLGIDHRVSPDWRLFAEAQLVDWSRFRGFDVSFASGRPNELRPIDWRDTWLLGAGVGWRVLPSTELTVGVSYDTGASEDGSGSTLSPDANKVLVGAGVIYDAPGLGRVSLSYGHLFVEESPVKAASLASGSLDGSLNGHMDMAGIGYTYEW